MTEKGSFRERTDPIAALVLAAGAATRMGRLKQILPYCGRTLVAHATEQALQAKFDPVIVVTGAESEKVREAVSALPVETILNPEWPRGMGSSIVTGLRHAQSRLLFAAAILLADQPLINARHLEEMSELLVHGPGRIVAAEYNGMLGVPALFHRELFQELLSLPPGAGARHILRRQKSQIAAYPLPEAALDIDTGEDFAGLQDQLGHNI